jgi:hypothetical protein
LSHVQWEADLAESRNSEKEDDKRSDGSAAPQLSRGEPASIPLEIAVERERNAVRRCFKY